MVSPTVHINLMQGNNTSIECGDKPYSAEAWGNHGDVSRGQKSSQIVDALIFKIDGMVKPRGGYLATYLNQCINFSFITRITAQQQ